jgi:biopolymer transport protein ExbB
MDESIVDSLVTYIDQGGFVMLPLVVGLVALWYVIGYRFVTLQRGTRMGLRQLVRAYQHTRGRAPRGVIDRAARRAVAIARKYPGRSEVLDDGLFAFYQDVKKGRMIIAGIVTVAPLLGLLGTVTGMIETFDSLGDMTLYAQSGGIAGGISQALFTTQLGLSVAIPGVIVGRLLDRRQRRLEEELDQIKALLAGTTEHLPAQSGGAA